MAKLTPQNLVKFTGTLQPGQRLIKRSDGTFIPVGATEKPKSSGSGNSGSSSGEFNNLDLFDWQMILNNNN